MDLRERLEALREANDEPLPSIRPESDHELKVRYLDLLREGENPSTAARSLGVTGTFMKRFRAEQGVHYDPDFHLAFEEIMRPGGEHQEALVQNLRAALLAAAESGNVRAIEKALMAWDPEFEFLRPSQWQGDTYNVERLVQVVFPDLPTHVLEQLIAHEEAKRKELPVVEQ